MRVPLSWLKEYIKLDLSTNELADILTLAGLEVDQVERLPFSFKGVVVGKIQEVKPHPHADKLKVTQVFDGSETVQVVCGDPQCREGMIVALAQIGASLTDEKGKIFNIKKSRIRDVESFGMLCTEKELGLSDFHETIMQLSSSAVLGTSLTNLFGDDIFEISLTPNLGHCMSIIGIARELAALMNQSVQCPQLNLIEKGEKIALKVEIKDQTNCSHYSARHIRNVSIRPSPDWLKLRLEHAGLRSINNIVDVTNYVMLELGQPLHAFDKRKLHDQKIIIDSLNIPQTFETLDGETREIPVGTLMIYNGKHPIAIAGLMGGANSAVDESTTEVILESAEFSSQAVRRSSKALNLRSDASARFERGIDPQGVIFALDRAAQLIAEVSGGEIAKGRASRREKEYKSKEIKLRLKRMNHILGTQLSLNEVESFLKRLEMKVATEEEICTVTIPSYRNDLHEEIDLIEEIARIFGYNNIKKREARIVNSPLSHAPLYLMEMQVREKLIGEGLQEVLNCDLISPNLSTLSLEEKFGKEEAIHVLHPSSIDQSILRTSLLPGLLHTLKHNLDRQMLNLSLFEIGKIHFKDGQQFKERATVAILLTGKKAPHHFSLKGEEADFFDLKGIIENLLEAFHCTDAYFQSLRLKSFHPGIQADIQINDLRLGVLGEIHPERLDYLDIKQRVFFAQIDLHDLMTVQGKARKMTPLPQYPGSSRDWTATFHRELPIGSLFEVITLCRSKLLKDFYLLDLYESDKIGKERKNVTFRFYYRDDRQTLEQSQVEKEHERLITEIIKKFRDFIY